MGTGINITLTVRLSPGLKLKCRDKRRSFAIRKALAEIINAAHPGWEVTPQQAFLMVHGGSVTFTKVGISCAADPQMAFQAVAPEP